MIWEVFYTPHTDDETIGMAGAILRAHAARHAVMVVLVTDNIPSTRGIRLFPEHDPYRERRIEWFRALSVLGVEKTQLWELSEVEMEGNPEQSCKQMCVKMAELSLQYSIAHHHTVWGADDVHAEASAPTLAHVLCANAAKEFRRLNPFALVSLHAVYIYSKPKEDRTAPIVNHLSDRHRRLKNAALDCYRPSADSIGYGYMSVPELFDSASFDPREFTQEVTYDSADHTD
jgi:LmbE family N-acetylglucosaminyl deacetylase